MEIVKYLCEFFFCNGWHFLGLVLVCFAISPKNVRNNYNNQTNSTKEE